MNAQNRTPITAGPAAVSRTAPPAPWSMPVIRAAAPVPMITLPRRFFYAVTGVAIGATAAFMFTVGAIGGSHAPARANGANMVTVAAAGTPSASMAGRGPNAEERARLNAAQSSTSEPCWAEWNDVQNGFEIICDTNPSVRSTPIR